MPRCSAAHGIEDLLNFLELEKVRARADRAEAQASHLAHEPRQFLFGLPCPAERVDFHPAPLFDVIQLGVAEVVPLGSKVCAFSRGSENLG